MKLSNKLLIFSACIFVLAFALLLSAWIRAPKEEISPKPNSIGEPAKTVETENNISESVKGESAHSTYTLKLVGNKICAYMPGSNGDEVLWNSMDMPPTLSSEEKLKLKNGISTSSFEELCLYFESYAS